MNSWNICRKNTFILKVLSNFTILEFFLIFRANNFAGAAWIVPLNEEWQNSNEDIKAF